MGQIQGEVPYRRLVDVDGRTIEKANALPVGVQGEELYNDGGPIHAVRVTDDGEVATTVTERELNVWIHHEQPNIDATQWDVLIDLDNTAVWPHSFTGRIDLSYTDIVVDRDSQAVGAVIYGVILSIDGTSAEVAKIHSTVFRKDNSSAIAETFNLAPSQWKLDVVDGALVHGLAPTITVTNLNTATQVESPGGLVTPDVGDLVAGFQRDAGTYGAEIVMFYHTQATTG